MTPSHLASRGLVEVEEVNLPFLLLSGQTNTNIEASTPHRHAQLGVVEGFAHFTCQLTVTESPFLNNMAVHSEAPGVEPNHVIF